MTIEYMAKVARGWIVLRLNKPDEWVTGYIPDHDIPEGAKPSNQEHVYGHYYRNRDAAHEDYLSRIKRGY